MESTNTSDLELVYSEPDDELTQHEIERMLRLAREAKRSGKDKVIIEPSHKSSSLYIQKWRIAA